MQNVAVFLAILILATSCQTTTKTTNRIAVGMSAAEVVCAGGQPFSKSADVVNGVSIERWIYKETTWDQGGWSWNRTVSDSEVLFRNGHVISFGVVKERHVHDRPGAIQVDVHHDE
jgi:hypothetical protein